MSCTTNSYFRNRCYYFDEEIGLYYLNSRYYDPEVGRFINADTFLSTGQGILGNNMFVYCGNNPVNRIDPTGKSGIAFLALATITLLGLSLVGCSSKENVFDEPGDTFRRYNVPLYSQGSYNLCWAFCQVMVESYISGETLSQKEATDKAIKIAKEVKNSEEKNVWNTDGMPSNWYKQSAPTTIEDLYDLLENGPVYATYGVGKVDEHIVVVTGVNVTKGIVYTNNPWGISGSQTYNEFLNGFLCPPFPTSGGMKLNKILTINYSGG